MYNSTIKRKIGHCKSCPENSPDKPLMKGLCPYHYQKERAMAYAEKAKKKRENDVEGKAKALAEWFAYHRLNAVRVCENCGLSLERYSEQDFRSSLHHIIDKSPINGCPSVAAVLENHGVLGLYCCHGQWHTSYENAQKMPFFAIAKKRFETFKHLIVEKRKIPQCFLD